MLKRFIFVFVLMLLPTFYSSAIAQQKDIPADIKELTDKFSSEFLDEREKARDDLVKKGKVVIPYLIEMLKSEDARIRTMSASALGRLNSIEALDELIAMLDDRDGAVKIAVVDSLGRIKDPKAIETLTKVLLFKDSSLSTKAKGSLKRQSNTNPNLTFGYLINVAGNIPNEEIVFLAETLADIAGNAPGVLVEALGSSYPRKAVARDALLRYGDKCLPNLVKVFDGNNYRLQREVAMLIGELRSPGGRPVLVKCLNSQIKFPYLRATCAIALRWIPGEESINALKKALKSDDPDVRYEAAESLGYLREKTAIDDLVKSLKDKNYKVRFATLRALGNIGDAKATSHLINALEDEMIQVQRIAAWSLGKIRDKSAIPELKKLLSNRDSLLRLAVAKSLAEMDNASGQDEIIRSMHNQKSMYRRISAYYAGFIRNKKPIQALISLLKDTDKPTKVLALLSLRRLTGQNFEDEHKVWSDWWIDNKETFEVKTEDFSAMVFKAQKSMQVGDLQGAAEAYQEILNVDSFSAEACNNLAWIYVTSDDPNLHHPIEGLRLAKRAVDLTPIPTYMDTLAEAYYANKNYIKAIETINRAIEMNPVDKNYFTKQKEKFIKALENERKKDKEQK